MELIDNITKTLLDNSFEYRVQSSDPAYHTVIANSDIIHKIHNSLKIKMDGVFFTRIREKTEMHKYIVISGVQITLVIDEDISVPILYTSNFRPWEVVKDTVELQGIKFNTITNMI